MLGFPIRTSADQCLVDGSPQLFAVTHVLHRFLAPRHPPLALRSLIYKIGISKMLVLALQFSKGDARAPGDVRTSTSIGRSLAAGRSTSPRACGLAAGSSMPALRALRRAPSKRKRRQGCRGRVRTEDGSYDDRARVPTAHQCTNWERTLDCRTDADIDERSAP